MDITVNGKSQEINNSITLQSYVEQVCPDRQRVIAEINEKIIKRENWKNYTLKNNDCVELVTFVGGG